MRGHQECWTAKVSRLVENMDAELCFCRLIVEVPFHGLGPITVFRRPISVSIRRRLLSPMVFCQATPPLASATGSALPSGAVE